jgi:hypothetical protein
MAEIVVADLAAADWLVFVSAIAIAADSRSTSR